MSRQARECNGLQMLSEDNLLNGSYLHRLTLGSRLSSKCLVVVCTREAPTLLYLNV